MKDALTRPRTVILWGVGLAVVGVLLVILVPNLVNMIAPGQTALGQDAQAVAYVFISAVEALLPPLGAAFIGAGLVMTYLERSRVPAGERE